MLTKKNSAHFILTTTTCFMLAFTHTTHANENQKNIRPSDFGGNRLYSVSCKGVYCSAVGYYTLDTSISKPLAYRSKNHGKSWENIAALPAPPTGALSSELDGVSCHSGGKCVAAGYYKNTAGDNLPLIYITQDFGNHWSKPITPDLKDLKWGMLFGVDCSLKSICVAVGEYYNKLTSSVEPLIIYGKHFTKYWKYPEKLPDAPASDSSPLRGIKCNKKGFCVAVGERTGTADDGQFNPLVYVSYNHGHHWSLAVQPFPPATGFTSGLYGVNCKKHMCVSVGYQGNSWDSSLTYYSGNFGTTWSIPILPKNPDTGPSWLYGVACNKKGLCTAVGKARADVVPFTRAFSYTSGDFGATWNISPGLPMTPDTFINNRLDGVNCSSNSICTAVGSYTDAGSRTKPIAYKSKDFGEHWSGPVYPPEVSISA